MCDLQAPTDPAGLRNLGNTCYVNAAMQFLHSLPAFRNALYKLEPELAEQDIVKQMRWEGRDLHASRTCCNHLAVSCSNLAAFKQ
jgi:hypothetical protein